jgi:hypothetical protein
VAAPSTSGVSTSGLDILALFCLIFWGYWDIKLVGRENLALIRAYPADLELAKGDNLLKA